MNTLPIWLQIVLFILGAGFIGNTIAIVALVINVRQKNQELQDAKQQRLNDNLLQNTRPHIDPLYIPINKILAKLESKYDEFKIARNRYRGYAVKKGLEGAEVAQKSQASVELGLLLSGNQYDAILALTLVCQELIDHQEKMIVEGTSAYLTAEFEKRVDAFTRFLRGVMMIAHTYLLSFKDVPEEQPKVYVLGTPEFEKELYTEIDDLREYIKELALGTTEAIKASSKKL
jgi:hypothetical protein